MPLYEDKLINPLAVRFTQEHIRPVFQDGTDLEETVRQIKTKPGTGGYDLLLDVPFDAIEDGTDLEETVRQIKTKPGTGGYDLLLDVPFDAIEVIRWHKRDASGEEAEARRWFTFDNRRLYCLQRAAAALWPRRVGVEVQALYAATDGSHRKDNSTTAGRSVHIGHSMKLLTGSWSWREAVASRGATAEAAEALALVARDEALAGVEALADAPAPPSMLERFLQGLDAAAPPPASPALTCSAAPSDESTALPSPRSLSGSEDAWAGLSAGLCGAWAGSKGDTCTVKANEQGWECMRTDKTGKAKAVQLWYDAKADCVWWGWDFYAQGSEARGQSGTVHWYGKDGSWDPKFSWSYAGLDAQGAKQPRARRAARGRASGKVVA